MYDRLVCLTIAKLENITLMSSYCPCLFRCYQGWWTDKRPPEKISQKGHCTKDHKKCQTRTKDHSDNRPPGQKPTDVESLQFTFAYGSL